jgi:hypothetical protein
MDPRNLAGLRTSQVAEVLSLQLDPHLNFEHEAHQIESDCGKSATRSSSLQIPPTRFLPPIFRQFAERIRSRIALEHAQAGGFARPRVTIISPL